MKSSNFLLTLPPDWLDAFREAAGETPLSEWIGERCRKALPRDVRDSLSARRTRGKWVRPKKPATT